MNDPERTAKREREADELAFELWEQIGLMDDDVRAEGDRVSLSVNAAKTALRFLPGSAMVFPPEA